MRWMFRDFSALRSISQKREKAKTAGSRVLKAAKATSASMHSKNPRGLRPITLESEYPPLVDFLPVNSDRGT